MGPIRKIVLIEPRSESPNIYSGIHIPRTGAVLLATLLNQAGYETKVFCEDIAPADEAEILSADLIGISALTNTARPAYEWAAKSRELGIPVVMGGTHATFMSEEALGHTDFVVKGEGEAPLLELLSALEGRRDFADIPNLSYWSGGRHGRGEKIHNPNRPFVPDLDAFPIPDFGLVHGWDKNCIASIMTSRGCPYDCTFCSVTAMLGRGYRYTSEDRVIEEIRRYREHDYIFFCDDNFAVNKKRSKNILRRKISEGLGMEWSAQVRAEITDDAELIALMRDSNCFNVYIGFESFNPKTLALYNKRMDVDRIRRSMDIFHKHGVKVHGMFVLGSDADDAESVRTTVRLAKKLDIDTTQFMILTPMPGTAMTRDLHAEGRIRTQDWDLFDGHYVTYEPRRMTPYELQRETVRAFRKFYSLPRIASRLIRGDRWTALLRAGARQYLKMWYRQNKHHLDRLREDILTEVRRLTEAGRKKRPKYVALPEGFLPSHIERFVRRFFLRLGAKVISLKIEVEGEMEDLAGRAAEALSGLRQRADLIIVPGSGPWTIAMGDKPLIEIPPKHSLPALFSLPIEEDGTPNYLAFTRIGMVFTKKGAKVKRAFDAALSDMGSIELPLA
ncbi:MAG: radical SAM protein [Nitrospinota bacterium]|nr:radical SAM protein [Nitrospinota bacterium]